MTLAAPDVRYLTADVFAYDPPDFVGMSCLITDPPFGDHVHYNAVSANRHGAGYVERDLGFAAITPALRNHIAKIACKMTRWSVVFTDFESTHLWRQEVHKPTNYIREIPYVVPGAVSDTEYAGELPWIRWSQPQKSGDRPTQGAEAVLHWHPKGAKHWNGPGSLTHYAAKALRGEDKHPTEKPLDLLLDMVSWWSDVGDTVVDVCAGAGTTALACRLLGRDCIALEKDAQWAPVAARRLALDWSDRDAERVARWIEATRIEADAQLSKPRTKAKDGRFNDENTRARATRRLEDVARVMAVVGAEVAA